MPSPWTRLRARVNPLLQPYFYTAYKIDKHEHVGRLDRPVDAVRSFLSEQGYGPQYLSAAKAHPSAKTPFGGDELHVLSYRRVPAEHPERWDVTKWHPEQCQYHVHAFKHQDEIELYSHYELRPLPVPVADENISTAFQRADKHYRPDYGKEYLRGVTDLNLTEVRHGE